MKATNKSIIHVIEDKEGNIIKPVTSGTYLFFSKKSRDKQMTDSVARDLWIRYGYNPDEFVAKSYKLVEVNE